MFAFTMRGSSNRKNEILLLLYDHIAVQDFSAYLIKLPIPKPMSQLSQVITNYLFK